jgi:hypothetical protein
MDPIQPSSPEGATLFEAMENMPRHYANGTRAAGATSPGDVTRKDALAAAHQVAAFIGSIRDPQVMADPGAAAANLMVMVEYISPRPGGLAPGYRDGIQEFVAALRQSGAEDAL